MYRFHIVIKPDEQNWLAYSPEMEKNGAVASGKTPQEALKNIQEVLELVVEDMVANNEKIPQIRKRNVPSLAISV